MGGGVTKRLPAIATAIVVFLALSLATVAPDAMSAAKLVALFSADFSPRTLSKTKPTPMRFTVTAKFKAGAAHPPPLKELLLRLDRHVRLGLAKLPTAQDVPGCVPGSGPRPRLGEIRKACGPAVVGNGLTEVEVQFPDQAPVPVESRLVALNGGYESGKARLYLYSDFSAPISGIIVTTMEIEKIPEGRYGLGATAVFPKIAGGYGSITSLALSLKRGVLSATCPNGRLDFRAKPIFADSAGPGERIVRTCVSKPEARR